MLTPVLTSAAVSSESALRTQCIESLEFTEKQIADGFHDYQIDRCIATKKRYEARGKGIARLTNRIQRKQKKDKLVIRNSRYRANYGSSVIRIGKDGITEEYRKGVQRFDSLPSRTRDTAALVKKVQQEKNKLRRERLTNARAHCADARSRDRNECIRVYLREIGTTGEKTPAPMRKITPRPIRQMSGRTGAQRANTKEEKRKRAQRTRERMQQARDACTEASRSTKENCVRNELRRLGRLDAVK